MPPMFGLSLDCDSPILRGGGNKWGCSSDSLRYHRKHSATGVLLPLSRDRGGSSVMSLRVFLLFWGGGKGGKERRQNLSLGAEIATEIRMRLRKSVCSYAGYSWHIRDPDARISMTTALGCPGQKLYAWRLFCSFRQGTAGMSRDLSLGRPGLWVQEWGY